MGLELRIGQKQKITQSMIQQVTILQMSAQELTEYMNELAVENPMVELESADKAARDNDAKDQERLKKLEWLSRLDEQNRVYYRQEKEDSEPGDMFNVARPENESLSEVLLLQLMKPQYSRQEQAVFSFIADSLNDYGYFTDSVEDSAAFLRVPAAIFRHCLDIMKRLEPLGVCAANLQECLLLQIDADDPEYAIERTVVSDYLELLGKNQLHVIAKQLSVPVSRIASAKEYVQSLNPKPSRGYASREVLRYLSPDVIIARNKDSFEILIDEYSYPQLRLNEDYMRLLRSGECDREVTHYLSDKVRQIQQVQDCVQKRNSTLRQLSAYLLDYQMDFFLYGRNYLKPLKMQDVADDIGVHESTISRAVKEKYLQCSWGLYPLEFFFSKGFFADASNEIMTTDHVKYRLHALIEAENHRKPLSDQKLCDLLVAEGIDISRRTVAKYRESMQIPDCRGRKEFQ